MKILAALFATCLVAMPLAAQPDPAPDAGKPAEPAEPAPPQGAPPPAAEPAPADKPAAGPEPEQAPEGTTPDKPPEA